MKPQQTNTTVEQLTNAEYMQRATISDDTRAVLVAVGKIQDAENEITDLIGRIYDTGAHELVDKLQKQTGEAIDILLRDLLPDLIVEAWMGDRRSKPAQI